MTEPHFRETRAGRLRNFFGGYFNQDWDTMAPTELELMDYAGTREDQELLQWLVEDLEWLQTEPGTSTQLWRRICDEYWSEYNGELLGYDAREWLRRMTARLASHIAS